MRPMRNPKPHSNLAARMGRWSAQHRRKAIGGWIAFVVLALFGGGSLGMVELKDSDRNVGESRTADHILGDAGLTASEESSQAYTEYVVIQSASAKAGDPAFRAVVRDTVATVEEQANVSNVRSPFAPGAKGQVAKDGRAAYVTFDLDGEQKAVFEQIPDVEAAIAALGEAHPGFRVRQTGAASAGKALEEEFKGQMASIGMLSVPMTIGILLIVFGAIVAAGLPVVLALSSVAGAVGLLAIPSQWLPMDPSVNEVILLVGLAVGVDYALFYLKREREERRAGRDKQAALEAAAATSGRAVLVSGLTVLASMAGMLFSGDRTFMSFGVGTALVVAIAMLGSLTVLPALMSRLNLERGRVPLLHRLRSRDGEPRAWKAILKPVLLHPVVAATGATAVLVALAIPAFSMQTTVSGLNDMPAAVEQVRVLQDMEELFPGGAVPAMVAIKAADVESPAVAGAIDDLIARADATGTMSNAQVVAMSEDRSVAQVSIELQGSGTDDASKAALAQLRDDVLPSTLGEADGVEYAVTGLTANSADASSSLKAHAPLVFGFVLALAFVLLLVSFRSVVIALKAIVLNLLSVAAAYGVLVLVFQEGLGEGLLGFESNGGIAPWLPMFLFVILFGLSMDYHVFILSRIREAFDRGMSTEDAVAHGITSTAGTVTSAAVVMVAAFAVFATMPLIDMKEMGVGLAAAVLIDATIVRAVLLPATMKLLGRWNWYLPSWLGWLPRLDHGAGTPAIPNPA